jgi:hypothetical protein
LEQPTPARAKSVADFAALRRQTILIVFSDDMRVRKNTLQSASVRAKASATQRTVNQPGKTACRFSWLRSKMRFQRIFEVFYSMSIR